MFKLRQTRSTKYGIFYLLVAYTILPSHHEGSSMLFNAITTTAVLSVHETEVIKSGLDAQKNVKGCVWCSSWGSKPHVMT
jgi:hypothetical protein